MKRISQLKVIDPGGFEHNAYSALAPSKLLDEAMVASRFIVKTLEAVPLSIQEAGIEGLGTDVDTDVEEVVHESLPNRAPPARLANAGLIALDTPRHGR